MTGGFLNLLAQTTAPVTQLEPTTRPAAHAPDEGIFLPQGVSTVAADIDWLFNYINAVTVVFTVGIFAVTIWFAIRYRESRNPVPEPPQHNNVLEVVWTVIPLILVLFMFWFGFRQFMDQTVAPPNADRIAVEGFTWDWNFNYPNPLGGPEVKSKILYLPANRPVVLEMGSRDVIHSLYLPEFRLKKDVVPGRWNKMWLEATKTGEYEVYCTEYCGDRHSRMFTKAIVLNEADYREQLLRLADYTKTPEGEPRSPVQVGEYLYTLQGCNSCHKVAGSATDTSGQGPSWVNMYGADQPLVGGGSVKMDYDYLRESIYYPGRKLAQHRDGSGKAYGNIMTPYPQLSEADVRYLVEYMKSLSDAHKAEADNRPLDDSRKREYSRPYEGPNK